MAIETATEACSAALLDAPEVHERFVVAPRAHGDLVLSMMAELLEEAGLALCHLDALAFGRGPGSFTGVRIAAGVVQGAAFAADLPVVPVSTLAALAQLAMDESGAGGVLAALDARMSEVYWGAYTSGPDGLARLRGEERVCAPAQTVRPNDERWLGAGSGWAAYGKVLLDRHGEHLRGCLPALLPRAGQVARLAARELAAKGGLTAERALPVYLREEVTRKPS